MLWRFSRCVTPYFLMKFSTVPSVLPTAFDAMPWRE